MSGAATAWVWASSEAAGAGLLVLLAVADAANHEGTDAAIPMTAIAKLARVEEDLAQRCITKLVEMGELVTEDGAYRLAKMAPRTVGGLTTRQRDAAFDKWYGLYPRKVGKIAAKKAFDKALKSATFRELGEGLERYVEKWRTEEQPMDKIPHPATWLNEGRWADDITPTTTTAATGEDPNAWMHRTSETQ